MDTKALEKYYPKKSWRNAYDDVKNFLISKDFEHEQGSGYHSVKPMRRAKAMRVIREMIKKHPWLNQCVRICTISDVPVMFDISYMFEKEEY
jgi:virulence-associated protein VapD